MTTRYRADEYADIAKHLKDIEAEKVARINGISLEDAKPVEAPEGIDWGMFAPCGFMPTVFTQYKLTDTIESVLPDWGKFVVE